MLNKNFQLDFLRVIPELVSRLVIGLVFLLSGWGKFQNLSKVTAYFESLEIPWAHFQAPFVSGVEFIAGICILIGLGTRMASLPLIVIMMVAIGTAKWEDVTEFSSLLDISEFLYIVILLWLACCGSKYLSCDALLCKYWKKGSGK